MEKIKNMLVHLLVWFSYFNLLVWSFSAIEDWEDAIPRALVIVAIHSSLFYLNARVLMPKFLEKRKVIAYVALLLSSLIFVVLFMSTQRDIFPEKREAFHQRMKSFEESRLPQKGKFKGPWIRKRRWIDPRTIGLLISSSAVLFVSSIYFNVKNKKRKDAELLLLKNQSLEAEQKFLKSQINPHFLFNTLNNLYSLANKKSDKTADAIQQLSEILRYSIYDSESELVNLEKEIEYIHHYINLQLLKDEGYQNKVSFETDEADGQLLIPPMLLLPFIENAFKHGNIATLDSAFVKINVKTEFKSISFLCENTFSEIGQSKDKMGGIGLKNVKRRLELLYDEKASLNIVEREGIFQIKLKMNV